MYIIIYELLFVYNYIWVIFSNLTYCNKKKMRKLSFLFFMFLIIIRYCFLYEQ